MLRNFMDSGGLASRGQKLAWQRQPGDALREMNIRLSAKNDDPD